MAEAPADLVWMSLVYQPDDPIDALTGPDKHAACETPRHKLEAFKPPAEWIELLWYPHTTKIVARCWKTCEACHVGMARTAEEAAEADRQ